MGASIREWFAGMRKKFFRAATPQAKREVMNTLFDDLYDDRGRVYRLNFLRGIFFGLGSVLGGTLVLAVAIWILTWFVDFPLIGQSIERLLEVLPSR